jgi:hypothetical protein
MRAAALGISVAVHEDSVFAALAPLALALGHGAEAL